MIIKTCIVCKKEFCVKKKGSKRILNPPIKRPAHAITCSKECTIIYNDIHRRMYQKNSKEYIEYQKNFRKTEAYKLKRNTWQREYRRKKLLLFKMA